MQLWRQAVNQGWPSLFIFEDDCTFREGFSENMAGFLRDVPSDWDMIYLGGLHRFSKADQPLRITDRCYRAWGVTGTWAYALSAKFLPVILRWFCEQSMYDTNHIDQMLCHYHVTHRPKVYIPHPWLCGMASGASEICGREYMGTSWWDWQPGQDAHPYIAVDLLGRSTVTNGVQSGCEFRMGFDPDMSKYEPAS
jgi:GR25 family glycosyltransferase involved in LPS biosynthesis